MKVTVLLLHILLSMVSAQLPLQCFKNGYIKARELYSINPLIFLTKPMDVSTSKTLGAKCGGEWSKFGVCCDPWGLPSHVTNNERLLNDSVKQMNSVVDLSQQIVGDLYLNLKKLSLAAPHPWYPQWTLGIDYAKAFLNNITNLVMLEEFKDFPSAQEKTELKTGNDACWAYMSKLRSASVCQTCSGRSQQFFKDDRGMVTAAVCYESLKLCLRPLQITVKFIRLVKWIMDVNDALKAIGLDCNIWAVGNQKVINSVYDKFVNTAMMATIEKMTLTNLESNPNSLNICNQYFSLAKVPYVQKFQVEAIYHSLKICNSYWVASEPILVSTDKIQKELPALEQLLTQKYTEWKASQTPRMLQTLAASPEFFESDVQFLSSSSSDGTIVTSEQNSLDQPLNLTMLYP